MISKKKWLSKWLIIPAIPVFLILSYFLYMTETGNFRVITPAEAYRSAQLDSTRLEYYIKKFGIRSVINLRGPSADAEWYINEIKTSSELGVKHYDVSLSALREPDTTQVQQLLEIFRSAPRPVLIHCQGGADRSGLVAAMWKVIVDKQPKSEAEKQLSIFYFHIPLGKTAAMDRFFQKWYPEKEL